MSQVNLKKEDGIAVISIEKPEALNALSRTIIDEMDDYIEAIKNDDNVRCIIFYSEKNFAAGADIKDMAECSEEEARKFSFSPTYNKIAEVPIPTIAAIEGYALGGGMELAMAADIRIAGENAKMGFPEVTLGIFPGGGGTIRVPRIVGEAFAKELIFTGDVVTAERAFQMGLVNRVVKEEQVYDEAIKLAKRIAARGPLAIRMAKEIIRQGLDEPDQNKGIDIESEQWCKLFNTYDQREGMRAFIEKRKPVFKNR
ncbi:enoyl-CoA hydratase/isomerase family protein [Clostridium aminobutyricum]|uniref:short-chain-enoyl-CoA hydratase n=1 Tax=Clostridium aminobutyricum TaxID=33953 RepID=A0A939IGA3_CLOAM|nr:enoyl-CoA hydratase-related protein [Clostridium aminobutyricum]MBN7772975.1 enoyl-CoA hydratase/isomerase family protein [Clostridium aminobutyricum]